MRKLLDFSLAVIIGLGISVFATVDLEPQPPQLSDHLVRYLRLNGDESADATTDVWLYNGFGNPVGDTGCSGCMYVDEESQVAGQVLWGFSDVATTELHLWYTSASTADAYTIADSGDGSPALLTLTPEVYRYVEITCNDVDTCDVTLGETTPHEGMWVTITNVSTNIVDFADTPGVSEIAGAFAMGQFDTLTLMYEGGTWFELHRSNN